MRYASVRMPRRTSQQSNGDGTAPPLVRSASTCAKKSSATRAMTALCARLASEGADVIVAASRQAAEDIMQDVDADAFAIEVQLPDGSGLDLVEELRNATPDALRFIIGCLIRRDMFDADLYDLPPQHARTSCRPSVVCVATGTSSND